MCIGATIPQLLHLGVLNMVVGINSCVESCMFVGLMCVCTMWRMTLLWRVVRSPSMCWFEQVESRCGCVSFVSTG